MKTVEDIFGQTKTLKGLLVKFIQGRRFSHSCYSKYYKSNSALKVSDKHGPVIYSKFEFPNPDGFY